MAMSDSQWTITAAESWETAPNDGVRAKLFERVCAELLSVQTDNEQLQERVSSLENQLRYVEAHMPAGFFEDR